MQSGEGGLRHSACSPGNHHPNRPDRALLTMACSSGRQSSQKALGQTSQRNSSPPAAAVLRPHVQQVWWGQAHFLTFAASPIVMPMQAGCIEAGQ